MAVRKKATKVQTAKASTIAVSPAPAPKRRSKKKASYDCSKCPGSCCGFPVIELTKDEMERVIEAQGKTGKRRTGFLKKHFEKAEDGGWQFKRKKHDTLGGICVFYKNGVGCSIYDVRPYTCRAYAKSGHCTIYSFLAEMRQHTGDKNYFPDQLHI